MAVVEPVLNVADIQGNILAGFNKDFQTFLFLRIGPAAADLTKARHWLKATLGPQLSSTDQVLAFNRAFKAAKFSGSAPPPPATWVNVAVSAPAVARILTPAVADQFGDDAFKLGLAKRSEFLGDPTDPEAEGNKRNWKVGGRPDNETDIVVIVASDEQALRDSKVASVIATLTAGGLTMIFQQDGATLADPWKGHEHFGFKDGVSQPGVRGRASAAADDFITARFIRSPDPRREFFGKPGQPLLWPGEFILGQPRQEERVDEPAPTNFAFFPAAGTDDPGDTATDFPAWAANGSYLVIRRLRQDFGAFWNFVRRQALELGMSPDAFGSLLVGRWRSGAPIMRSPGADNPALAADDLANNHFAFNKPSTVAPIDTTIAVGYPGDGFPQATHDFLGTVCPHFAHIRKVNPRDGATDLGVSEDSLFRHQIRRGIPYGETVLNTPIPTPVQLAQDRGLVFASYQASIVNQFETVIRRWNNNSNLPTPGGHDPIIGQEETIEGGRRRFIDLPTGKRCFLDHEWVIPTGGGYFFAPSISAVRNVLGA